MIRGFSLEWSRSPKIMQSVILHVKLQSLTLSDLLSAVGLILLCNLLQKSSKTTLFETYQSIKQRKFYHCCIFTSVFKLSVIKLSLFLSSIRVNESYPPHSNRTLEISRTYLRAAPSSMMYPFNAALHQERC